MYEEVLPFRKLRISNFLWAPVSSNKSNLPKVIPSGPESNEIIYFTLEYKKRAPTFVRLAMRRTSSALGLDVMRRNKANNNFLVKEDSQEFHLGPFTMTKKIEH